jgi:uncharacterized protein (DUF2147 family)
MKTKLIEAIVTSQFFKDYILLCQEDAKEETVKAEKIFRRREKFANKILLCTSCCGLDSVEAKKVCLTLLEAIDMAVLKNVRWLAQV